jgi:hypothetical protein
VHFDTAFQFKDGCFLLWSFVCGIQRIFPQARALALAGSALACNAEASVFMRGLVMMDANVWSSAA